MSIPVRYVRNVAALTEAESSSLASKTVAVIGCGGLGGYTIEMLARIGVGHLKVVDPDVFEESNLNRQILCTERDLGRSKAEAACKRVEEVNSSIDVKALQVSFGPENGEAILTGCDCAVDALDSLRVRSQLAQACAYAGIPLIYGAIAGWYGQVSVIYPDDGTADMLFDSRSDAGEEIRSGNPSFTPACIAAHQVAEAIKVLLGRPNTLRKKLLLVDLLSGCDEVVDLQEPGK